MTSLDIDNPAVIFVIGLVISTIIIFIVTKLFRGKTDIGKAFVTALIGTLGCYILSLRSWTIGNSGGRYSLVICIKRHIST